MIKKVQNFGNSKAIILDIETRKKANINDYVDIEVKDKKVILKNPSKNDLEKFKELTEGA